MDHIDDIVVRAEKIVFDEYLKQKRKERLHQLGQKALNLFAVPGGPSTLWPF